MGIFFLGNNHPKDCWDDTNKHNASKYTPTQAHPDVSQSAKGGNPRATCEDMLVLHVIWLIWQKA